MLLQKPSQWSHRCRYRRLETGGVLNKQIKKEGENEKIVLLVATAILLSACADSKSLSEQLATADYGSVPKDHQIKSAKATKASINLAARAGKFSLTTCLNREVFWFGLNRQRTVPCLKQFHYETSSRDLIEGIRIFSGDLLKLGGLLVWLGRMGTA
jgi:hypothetical protein